MSTEANLHGCDPDPDHPGWLRWQFGEVTPFNEIVLGHTLVRKEDEDTARVRIFPALQLTNNTGKIHGGATLGLIDVALFAAARVLRGVPVTGSVTLAIDTQFIGAANGTQPIDAVVDFLRETGRMVFMRGLVEQDGSLVASFQGTIRKAPRA